MAKNNTQFGSDSWLPALKSLCLDYLKNMQKRPGGKYLNFKDELGTEQKPGRIVKEYHKTVVLLKNKIFGEKAEQSLIDHHKISALYIRAILKYKPFYIDKPKESKLFEPCLYVMLANEYFTIPFLTTVFRLWNNNLEGLLKMDQKYLDNYIKMLYSYKKDITTLNPLSFSNTIFLIEQLYFK